MNILTKRLEALVERGYNIEDVVNLSSFSDENINDVSDFIFNKDSYNIEKVENPVAIFAGGQPGSGKSVLAYNSKMSNPNLFIICVDNYRSYHTNYFEIEKLVKEHWIDRIETNNDSPGNDIADFTHDFSCIISDKLTERAMKKDEFGKSYNIFMEWAMREPYGPMETMKQLKRYNYIIKVMFICVHKSISLEACNLRSDVMKDTGIFIRKIPEDYHNHCADSLPNSVNVLYEEGYKNKLIDYLILSLRDGSIIWQNGDLPDPGSIYYEYLNNLDLTKKFNNNETLALINNKIELSGKDILAV